MITVLICFCSGLDLGCTPEFDQEIASKVAMSVLKDQTFSGYCERGIERLKSGKYKSAIEDFNKSIQLNPNHGRAFNNRGNAKRALSDNQGALVDFTKAIELGYSMSFYNRAEVLSKLDDRRGAISDLSKCISLQNLELQSYACRGWERECIGDNAGAISDFAKACEFKPQNADEFGNIAWIAGHLGDHRRAVEYFDKAIRLDTKDSWLFEKRGLEKEKLGDRFGAFCDYAQSCKLDCHYLHIAYHVYRLLGAYATSPKSA